MAETKKGHYSPGVVHNGLLYVSGQLPVNAATGTIAEGGVREQTRQALANLDKVLTDFGTDRTKVLQCRVYTPDVALWDEINAVYAEYFGDHKPSRTIVPTSGLHYGSLIEIEALAVSDGEDRA